MPEIQKTLKDAAESLTRSGQEKPQRKPSSSRIAERLRKETSFWEEWHRQPALDVAESVLRLRRLRGLRQEDLAQLMETQQPAIARIESGRNPVSTRTLERLAKALRASVRIRMEPIEHLWDRPLSPSWWDPQPAMEIEESAVEVRVFSRRYVIGAMTSYGGIPSPEVLLANASTEERGSASLELAIENLLTPGDAEGQESS